VEVPRAELESDALLTKRDRELFAFLCDRAPRSRSTALEAMRPDKRKGYVLLDVDEGHQGPDPPAPRPHGL
jgi:hypothetical protein